MTSSRIAFLPWATLPREVCVGGFRFTPVNDIGGIVGLVGNGLDHAARTAMRAHVDKQGEPIASCTLIRRVRVQPAWELDDRVMENAFRASQLLAFCTLAEQEFFKGHFAPHMNATMFRPISMPVHSAHESLGTYVRRRGGGLRTGGLKTSEVYFQMPEQVDGTETGEVNTSLAKALWRARRAKDPIWSRFEDALPFFLLANAEEQLLPDSQCLLLSAISFERLLRPKGNNASNLAKAFASVWDAVEACPLRDAKRLQPDESRHRNEQLGWPLRRKWIKELYESRSEYAHGTPRPELVSNWTGEQHMVLSAFAFPLTVKLLLSELGHYQLSRYDEVRRDVFDRLLDSDWRPNENGFPEWDDIISMEHASRSLEESFEYAVQADFVADRS